MTRFPSYTPENVVPSHSRTRQESAKAFQYAFVARWATVANDQKTGFTGRFPQRHTLTTANPSFHRLSAYQSQNRESTALANEELATLQKDLDRTLEEHTKLAEMAGSLEREKHYIEAALQKRVAEFEAERTVLRARIEDMSEDVRVKAEATAQAELLKVRYYARLRTLILYFWHWPVGFDS